MAVKKCNFKKQNGKSVALLKQQIVIFCAVYSDGLYAWVCGGGNCRAKRSHLCDQIYVRMQFPHKAEGPRARIEWRWIYSWAYTGTGGNKPKCVRLQRRLRSHGPFKTQPPAQGWKTLRARSPSLPLSLPYARIVIIVLNMWCIVLDLTHVYLRFDLCHQPTHKMQIWLFYFCMLCRFK